MTLQSDTFDYVGLVRRIAEAALGNEESIEVAVAEMQRMIATLQKAERGFEVQQKSLPLFVAAEVDRKLVQTVSNATAQISARFDDTYQAAERARKSFDDAAERVRNTSENTQRLLSNNFMWTALGCFTFGCVGMIVGVWLCAQLFLPPSDILQRQREAEQAVATLAPQGGKSELSWCEGRRCVRTDEKMRDNLFGNSSETYRIIYGY